MTRLQTRKDFPWINLQKGRGGVSGRQKASAVIYHDFRSATRLYLHQGGVRQPTPKNQSAESVLRRKNLTSGQQAEITGSVE